MKTYLFILIAVFGQSVLTKAQQLKQTLSTSDFIYLDKQIKDCFAYEVSIAFSFNSQDFYDNKSIEPDKPNSLKQIKDLEKKLKGNYRDAAIYNNIGMAYKGMFMPEEANKNFNKALELAKEYVKNNPDSTSANNVLALIYLNLGNVKEAALIFQKSYSINKDSTARAMIPFCLIYSGNFEAAISVLDSMIVTQPDDLFSYSVLLFTMYWEKANETQGLVNLPNSEIERLYKDKKPEEIIDIVKIKNGLDNNKNDVRFQLLYQLSKHLSIIIKSSLRTTANPASSMEKSKFILDDVDKVELQSIALFYIKCLNDTQIANKYLINKALGNIYLMIGDAKKAIPYLETACKQKPLNKSTFLNNAANDYDNLAAAYLILNDTASFEKIVKQKFDIKPAINPLPSDYVSMAKISFFHNDFLKAKEYSEQALKMDPEQYEAYICLVAIELLQRNTKKSAENLNQLYIINPNIYNLYILQGICSLFDNDISTAYTSFTMAKLFVNDPTWIDNEIINKFFIKSSN